LTHLGRSGIGETGVEPCVGEGFAQCLCAIHRRVSSCLGFVREVPRLDDGGATEEGERRDGHPLILEREKTDNAIGVRFFKQLDDVFRLGMRLPLALRSA
jgi:hypothetical protein